MMLLYTLVLLWFSSQSESASEFLNLISLSKQEKLLSEFMTNLCSFGHGNPVTPDLQSMSFILFTRCKKLSFPLKQTENIPRSSDFYVNKKVAIYVTGWMSTPEEDYVTDMAHAFDCRGDYNFLVLDSSYFITTLYTWSAYNTEEIGRQVALALKKLISKVAVKNIHLIGHSLGAHIVGYAGRYFNKYTGLKITRITALDPAMPCFHDRQHGLKRGDAIFIDVIHTNSGVLGLKSPLGDADFYPEGFDPIQPGCIIIGCSHDRAQEYFIESVYPGNEQNFLAKRYNSLKNLKN